MAHTVGKRRIKSKKVGESQPRNGFDVSSAEIRADSILIAQEKLIAEQDAGTQKALDDSNKGRQKMVDRGLFGGLGG